MEQKGKESTAQIFEERNQEYEIIIKIEINCREEGVPRKKVEPLFKRVYDSILRGVPQHEIAPLVKKIIYFLLRHMDQGE